ncbi:MAG: hypothetical protein V3U73_05890 [bacterium]
MSKNISLVSLVFLIVGWISLGQSPSLLTLVLCLLAMISVLFLLYYPSIWTEEAFASISYKLKISSLIAGGVFLAASSSTPEFFTSFSGVVLHKVFAVGIGTVLWSALFNLCVIIGVCSLYKSPLTVNPRIYKRDMPFYGIAILALILLSLDKTFTRIDFLILVSIYVIYIIFLSFDKSEPYKDETHDSWSLILGKMFAGIILIGVLSHLLVTLGLRMIVLSESLFDYIFPVTLLAALIFAPGTSISDLLMSISATKRGEDSVAIVNGVASNTFDLTICLGVPGLAYTMVTNESVSFNIVESGPILGALLIGYIVAFVFIYTQKKIFKWEGWILLIYFLIALLMQIGIVIF